ncbi:MAG TPA: hypothetical protein VLE72_01915 [Candidatus Saccharimonadales bacterium]|nr:hypothetical protein [Candidatus Saccharimonadales bacterium]
MGEMISDTSTEESEFTPSDAWKTVLFTALVLGFAGLVSLALSHLSYIQDHLLGTVALSCALLLIVGTFICGMSPDPHRPRAADETVIDLDHEAEEPG